MRNTYYTALAQGQSAGLITLRSSDQNPQAVLFRNKTRVVFIVSTKEINLVNNTSTIKKLPCGKHRNMRFDIDADDNGWGIVYHRSDCSYGYYRMYSFGGSGPCSVCDNWLVADLRREWNDYYGPIVHSQDHNWTHEEIIAQMINFLPPTL